MFVNFNILNQLGSPAINSNTFANRPAAGQTGRLFVSTDTFEIYRDNGTTWDLIGGPGSSTITGTGTATQVAYFTSSQAIGSSANLYWDNTNTRLGIGTSTPGVRLDIHGTGIMQHINATSATANSLMAFQRTGTNVWRLGDQYNGGSNYFELHNTSLASNAIQIAAATNKSILTSIENYSTGVARGNLLDYTLSLSNGTTFTSPNTVTALGATLNLNIAGSATIPAGARSGADFFNGINFTSAGTFTVNQASTIRAFSNVTAGWAFNGSAVGTVTHLAGLRVLFPTNSGSAINVTDNYALLINNQNANTGTITYTNRWGIYQEGASDLNYMAANLLLGSTVNTGDKLQVTGTTYLSSQLTVGNTLYVDTVFNRVGIGTTNPTGTATPVLHINGTSNSELHLTNSTTGTVAGDGFTIQQNGNDTYIWNYENSFMSLGTNNSERIRITSGGNVGIGVTPQTWNAGFKALQIGARTSLAEGSLNDLVLGYNFYQDTGGTNRYIGNGGSNLLIVDNEFKWFNAPTGIAGNAVTFTQAMTLNANGQLLIGSSTNAENAQLKIAGGYVYLKETGGGDVYLRSGYGANTDPAIQVASNDPLLFLTSNTVQAVLTNGGNFLIGTTTDAGQKLQVNGTTSITSDTQIGNPTTNTYYGGFLFFTKRVAQGTTTNLFSVPNATWAGTTEITYASSADYNRSGAILVRWAYLAGPNNIGIVNTIYDVSQNATVTLSYLSGNIRINITGGAADYYVQIKVSGTQAA